MENVTLNKMSEAVPNLLYEQIEELKKRSETASNEEIIEISEEICKMTQRLTQFSSDIEISRTICQERNSEKTERITKITLIVASIALGVSAFALIMNVLGVI